VAGGSLGSSLGSSEGSSLGSSDGSSEGSSLAVAVAGAAVAGACVAAWVAGGAGVCVCAGVLVHARASTTVITASTHQFRFPMQISSCLVPDVPAQFSDALNLLVPPLR
jgi:hypothetical protein